MLPVKLPLAIHRPALICLLFLGLASPLVSQNRAAATEEFRDGTNYLLAGKPKKAVKAFSKATKLDEGFLPAHRFLGLSEELTGNLPAAAAAYEHVLEADSLFSRLLYYQLGKVYYRMSRPAEAEQYLRMFQDLQEVDLAKFGLNGDQEREDEAAALKSLHQDLRAARITQDSSQFINITGVKNLGFPINTVRDDYFPFFANDLNSFYYTRQGELRDEDLIEGKRSGHDDASWTTNRFGNFNTLQPEGMCTLVRDGERIYFTLCHEDTGQGGCDLFAGWLIDGKVKRMEPLPNYINTPSWESQPSISCDGQQLFFASIRPGGLGGSDIYRCFKNEDGTWSEPQNLGDGVNTPEDEEGPFLSNDGRTLYFSSMGHQGLGDQDIFTSWWDDKHERFTQAINLGPPVNGPHRELGFHLTSDGRTGFFASDRPGGNGGLDIYQFKLSNRLTGRDISYVSGYVTDSITGEPIANQAVPVADGATYYTNFDGRFFICAKSEQDLPLSVNAPTHLPYQRTFPIPSWDNRSTYRIDLRLQRDLAAKSPGSPRVETGEVPPPDSVRTKARVVKRNFTVRFEFDDDSLLPLQIENINDFVASVKDKPLVSIEITGFTDASGPEGYNIELSRRRARKVADHLRAAGVTSANTQIIGLGEVPGMTARALNRKVEIKVVYREQVPINR